MGPGWEPQGGRAGRGLPQGPRGCSSVRGRGARLQPRLHTDGPGPERVAGRCRVFPELFNQKLEALPTASELRGGPVRAVSATGSVWVTPAPPGGGDGREENLATGGRWGSSEPGLCPLDTAQPGARPEGSPLTLWRPRLWGGSVLREPSASGDRADPPGQGAQSREGSLPRLRYLPAGAGLTGASSCLPAGLFPHLRPVRGAGRVEPDPGTVLS